MGTKTRFEKEAKSNSEMAYCTCISFMQPPPQSLLRDDFQNGGLLPPAILKSGENPWDEVELSGDTAVNRLLPT